SSSRPPDQRATPRPSTTTRSSSRPPTPGVDAVQTTPMYTQRQTACQAGGARGDDDGRRGRRVEPYAGPEARGSRAAAAEPGVGRRGRCLDRVAFQLFQEVPDGGLELCVAPEEGGVREVVDDDVG